MSSPKASRAGSGHVPGVADMIRRWIVQTPGTCGGKPRIRGRKVSVAFIQKHFYAGVGVAALAETLRLYPFQVEAAIRFCRKGKHGY